MFRTLADFETAFGSTSESTLRVMKALTDASLAQAVAPESRDLGRLAWHVAGSLREMAERTGLHVEGPAEAESVPTTAAAIALAYERSAKSLAAAIRSSWTDASLEIEDEMYGQAWKRGHTLFILLIHEIHHRGQMTVLMRQAGLIVPGVCGPAREEWAAYGMPAPAI
jgi:uncharacterized damage-inducible protein DinB